MKKCERCRRPSRGRLCYRCARRESREEQVWREAEVGVARVERWVEGQRTEVADGRETKRPG